MRRPILAALLMAGTLALCAPLGAAAARLDIVDSDVYNEQGQALTRVAVGQTVRLQARVENTGDAQYNGSLSVVFTIVGEEDQNRDYVFNRTITTNQSLDANEGSNVTLSWIGPESGKFALETYVQGDRSTTFVLRFSVAETEVVRRPLTQSVVDYLWLYAAFACAIVLFFAVARQRRAR